MKKIDFIEQKVIPALINKKGVIYEFAKQLKSNKEIRKKLPNEFIGILIQTTYTQYNAGSFAYYKDNHWGYYRIMRSERRLDLPRIRGIKKTTIDNNYDLFTKLGGSFERI